MDKNVLWWIVFSLVIVSALILVSTLQMLWEELKKRNKDE